MEEMKRIISEKYKLVSSLSFEDDITSPYIETGEYWEHTNPPIMGHQSTCGSAKRGEKLCKIRFSDNTRICLRLKPEDYLSKIRKIRTKTELGYGCKGLATSYEREIDINKVLCTILDTLKNGYKKENISFETLDSLSL
jgi:hypothetical protein